jgi:dihydrofolate reductase
MAALILLAAIGHRRVIGRDNQLPWHLPEDLKHFKALTTGQVVVMGRKTFESIRARLGRPLPNRHSVVLTRDLHWRPTWSGDAQGSEVSVLHRLEALTSIDAPSIYIIGGAEIYALTLPLAAAMEITEVDLDVAGDAFFPEFEPDHWQITAGPWQLNASAGHRYRFVRYSKALKA